MPYIVVMILQCKIIKRDSYYWQGMEGFLERNKTGLAKYARINMVKYCTYVFHDDDPLFPFL